MDQSNQLDVTSLKESPRRQQDSRREKDNQSARGQQPSEAAVLEASLPTSRQVNASNQRRVRTEQGGAGLSDVPVGQKLILIALTFIVPIAVMLFFLVNQFQQDLTFARKELDGVSYLKPLISALTDTQQHRGLTNRLLNGDPTAQEAIDRLDASLDASYQALSLEEQRFGEALGTNEAYTALLQTWQDLETQLEGQELSAPESFQRHTSLIQEHILPLIRLVNDNSNLILDPELNSYYLMTASVLAIPPLTEDLGQMRGFGSGVIARGTVTPQEQIQLFTWLGSAEEKAAETFQAVNTAIASDDDLEELSGLLTTAQNSLQENEALIRSQFSGNAAFTATPEQYFAALTQTLEHYVTLGNQSLELLERELGERIAASQQSMWIALGATVGVLALATLVIAFIARLITRPLQELGRVSDSVGRGDLSQLANIESRDEIGRLAKSFNNSILQLRDANARQEAEIARGQQLQQNIGQFLEVAMDIAQGDLTKRGQVSEDALGNVVDAINYMTEELGYVLKGVQNATQSVNQGATDMFSTTDSIAQSAEVQASEAQKAREDVQGIRSTMRQVSEEMTLSAESATQALRASREGQEAVVQTLEGMQDIRREVQAVSKRVKNLGDRSLEISEIVETISKISEQTNLLAVNAAIESSGAGEAGLRFAVVADQVRKLAEESAYAAERVAILIKTVQDEVQEVITGVEAGTREVEEGYRVASQAGQRLEDIAKIVERSAELAQRISKATQDQVARVEQVGQVVEQMAEISQASQSTVSQGRVAAEKLQQLATQLSDNLARFRLA